MADCTTMKKGEVYTCKDCGFSIQVIEECDRSEVSSYECSSGSTCSFSCCGDDLVKKTS